MKPKNAPTAFRSRNSTDGSARSLYYIPDMEPSLTDTLCVGYGLCCDGTLFAELEAAMAEVTQRIRRTFLGRASS